MKLIVAGGTGLIGKQLVPALVLAGHEISVIGRHKDKINQLFSESVHAYSWDELNQLKPDDYDAIINLAGESIAARRWSDTAKRALLESRLHSTQALVRWALHASQRKPHLYNASAIGIYGLHAAWAKDKAGLTEQEVTADNQDFASSLVKQWEAAALKAQGMAVTLMRFGVVLKRYDGMLSKLELPAKMGLSAVVGSGKQPNAWVDCADVVLAIQFLLSHPEIIGPVNIVAPEIVTQAEFTYTLAKALNRPVFLRLPHWFVKAAFGQMGVELLLSGQAVSPSLLQSKGFQFKYPTLQASLAHQLQEKNAAKS